MLQTNRPFGADASTSPWHLLHFRLALPSLHLAEVTTSGSSRHPVTVANATHHQGDVNPSRSQSQPATEPKSTHHQGSVTPSWRPCHPLTKAGLPLHGDDASSHEDEANLTPCERQPHTMGAAPSHHETCTLSTCHCHPLMGAMAPCHGGNRYPLDLLEMPFVHLSGRNDFLLENQMSIFR